MTERVSICVLLYGNHASLARQCLESIIKHCERDQYRLIVGCNACCDETLAFVGSLREIDRLIVSSENLNKCPMQRRMLADIDTEFVWWFDDDSRIESSDALPQRLQIADQSSPETVLWGPIFYWQDQAGFNFGIDVEPWIREQAWYSREPIPCDASGKWVFVIGGSWLARTQVLRDLDWPPRSFLKPGDDALFCEAIRQSGLTFEGIGECGVSFQLADRRAPETETMMAQQVRRTADNP